ncbi:MAG: hypothetical protein WCK90_00905 [archaeon]
MAKRDIWDGARPRNSEEDEEQEEESLVRGVDTPAGDDSKLIHSAINYGMQEILKKHPSFAKYGDYISKHVDRTRLQGGIEKAYAELAELEKGGKRLSPEKKNKFIYEKIAGYVASGGAFDDHARVVVLKKSLEGRAVDGEKEIKLSASERKDEKYLEQTIDAFRNVYDMFKSGDYAQRMPELTEALGVIEDMGFARSAIDVLYQKGVMDEGKYRAIRGNISKKVRSYATQAQESLAKYSAPKKAAATAAVIGLSGGIFLMDSNLSGNVIGSVGASWIGGILLAVGFLGLGGFIYFRNKVKRRK